MTKKIYDNRKWLFLILGFLYIAVFWPGFLSPDSKTIMAQAMSGQILAPTPPLLAYLWSYLMKIYPGGGLMLVVQAGLLWGAAYNLSFLVGKKWPLYICFLLPFYPGFIANSAFIWKDVHFAHGYIFIASVLARQAAEGRRLNWWQLLGVVALLFYATSVKYQARFLAPLMSLWIVGHQTGRYINLKTMVLTAVLAVGTIVGTDKVSDMLIPPKHETYFWQFVKIFDLAGISVNTGEVVVPKFLKRSPDVTVKDIESHYDYLWEPLIKYPDSPLRETASAEEREVLLSTWRKQVLAHPWAYVKHRWRLWVKIVQQNSLRMSVERAIKGTSIPQDIKWLTYIFSYGVWIPVLIFYILFGMHMRRTARAANSTGSSGYQVRLSGVLILLSLLSLTLPAFLFVFSLAATPRYVYFSQVFLAFAHPVFLTLILKKWFGRESHA